MKNNVPIIVMLAASIGLAHPAGAALGSVGGAIGKIGASNEAAKKKKGESENAAGQPNDDTATQENVASTPIVTIPFNRSHINFRQVLGNPVIQNERENPGAGYELVSSIPTVAANAKRQDRLNRIYNKNMNTVRDELIRLGVGAERIRVRTEYRMDDRPQEVGVFTSQ